MFYLGLCIASPFKSNLRNFFSRGGRITKNKSWEFEIFYSLDVLIDFDLSFYPTGQSHAGLEINIGILGLHIGAKIYDNRHWDYDNNCWENYDAKI